MSNPSRSTASSLTAETALPRGASAATLLTPRFVRVLAVQFAFGFAYSAYFLLPKYLATELQASATTIGALGAAPLLAGVLASPFIGRALDELGRRPLMIAGALLCTITALGMVTVTSVGPWLYALRLLQGIGFSLVLNSAAAMIADHAPSDRLAQAMGLLGAASLVTNAAAPAAAEFAAHAWGWAPVFLGTAVMSLLTLLLALGTHPQSRRATAEVAAQTPRELWGLLYIGAVTGAAFGTLITFTQPFALEQGAERVAGFFVGYTVSALLIRLGLGNIGDRLGKRRVATISLLLYGLVTMAVMGLRPGLLELYGLAFGAAHGLLYPSLAGMVAEQAQPERRGRALTLFHAAFNGGCGIVLLGAGAMAEHTGYAAVFALVGSGVLASVPVLALSGRTSRVRSKGTP